MRRLGAERMMAGVWIALGGALGALCRWGCVRAAVAWGAPSPFATLAVNVLGSFLAGALFGPLRAQSPVVSGAVFLGFLGAFTTFSTYTLETANLTLAGEVPRALLNLALQNLLGLAAAFAGLLLTLRA